MLITELEREYLKHREEGGEKTFDYAEYIRLTPYLNMEYKITLVNHMVDELVEIDENGWGSCDEGVRRVIEFLFLLSEYTDVTLDGIEPMEAYDIACRIGLTSWVYKIRLSDMKVFLDFFHKSLINRLESINSPGAVLNRHMKVLEDTLVTAAERFSSLDVSPETIQQVQEGLLSINDTMSQVKELTSKD